MRYLYNLLVAVDQLANAITGGNPDATVSARVGYFARPFPLRPPSRYWTFLQRLINLTFAPWEASHCWASYQSDRQERYTDTTRWSAPVLLVGTTVTCGLLIAVLYPVHWLRQGVTRFV